MKYNKVVMFVVDTRTRNLDTLVKNREFENTADDALLAFTEARYDKYGVCLRSGSYSVSDFEIPPSVDNCALCCVHKHNSSGSIVDSYAVTLIFQNK